MILLLEEASVLFFRFFFFFFCFVCFLKVNRICFQCGLQECFSNEVTCSVLTEILSSDFWDIYLSHKTHKMYLLLNITHMILTYVHLENT